PDAPPRNPCISGCVPEDGPSSVCEPDLPEFGQRKSSLFEPADFLSVILDTSSTRSLPLGRALAPRKAPAGPVSWLSAYRRPSPPIARPPGAHSVDGALSWGVSPIMAASRFSIVFLP